MREIKFRGKCNDGMWINGYLIKTQGSTFICYANQFNDDLLLGAENICVEVYPETIGQYTGLKDKNGKEIYEGDIFLYDGRETAVIKWVDELMGFAGVFDGDDTESLDCDYCEIIGNIHDNPELLK